MAVAPFLTDGSLVQVHRSRAPQGIQFGGG